MSLSNIVEEGGAVPAKHLYCHALSASSQSYLEGGIVANSVASSSTATLELTESTNVGDALSLSGASTAIDIAEDGIYSVQMTCSFPASGTGYRALWINMAGVNSAHTSVNGIATTASRLTTVGIKRLSAGDTIQGFVWQSSGAPMTLGGGVMRYAVTKLS